jgi:integrase
MAKLTALEVAKIVDAGMHRVDDGLYLQIKGGRSWVHRYMFRGKQRLSGLGSADPKDGLTLAQARAARDDERALIRKDIDPVAERKRRRGEKTAEQSRKIFRNVARDFIANHEGQWRNPVHRKQWTSTLETYVYPVIGEMWVDEIITDHVRQVLQPIWYAKPETARRVRGRIEKILGFAKPLGLRSGENPARLADNLEHIFPKLEKKRKIRHHPALPYAQIPIFVPKLREQEGVGARALEFVILTAARTGDIIGQEWDERPPMKWEHVDFGERLWTIPATKNDGEHKVPLSDPAMAVLKSMQTLGHDTEIVFPSLDRRGQPMSNNAMLALLERMGHGDITVHGFRSTFRDWAGECTNFPRELAEKALAHTVGDETERAYQRGDLLNKRRKLMETWAGYCTRPAAIGEVVQMRR